MGCGGGDWWYTVIERKAEMKLNLSDLGKIETSLTTVESVVETARSVPDFLQDISKNVKIGMDILDQIGMKEVFIAKARKELSGRLGIGDGITRTETASGDNSKRRLNDAQLDMAFNVLIGWIAKFIVNNGDMPLSELKEKLVENRKDVLEFMRGIEL